MKKLLMLGATSRGIKELFIEAKRRGIYTIATDYLSVEEAPIKLLADEYWMISTSEIDELEKKCRETGVNAVISGISTFNISIAIQLCKRLGIPCYCTPQAWRYTIDKRAFKDLCMSCHVPVATDYFVSKHPTDEELEKIQFPVVVKAIDQSANKGMSYCNTKDELLAACAYARSVSASETVIVERMLNGREYTAWYAIADGVASLVNFSAMFSQTGYPSNCYSVTTTNTDHLELFLKEVNPFLVTALNKAGCREGFAWIEMMQDDGHFYALEMGYRMSGDMMALPHKNICGFDTYSWLIDIAMGVEHVANDLPEPQSKLPERCGCSYILWSKEGGVISSIEGIDQIMKLPNIHINVDGTLRVGTKVSKHQYLFIITFDTVNCEEMCKVIDQINNTVRIYNEKNEDIIIRYRDFKLLQAIKQE